MSDVTFITSRAINLDGYEYTISVYQDRTDYFAFWECKSCRGEWSLPISARDKGAAIQECEKLINQHHAKNHSRDCAEQQFGK